MSFESCGYGRRHVSREIYPLHLDLFFIFRFLEHNRHVIHKVSVIYILNCLCFPSIGNNFCERPVLQLNYGSKQGRPTDSQPNEPTVVFNIMCLQVCRFLIHFGFPCTLWGSMVITTDIQLLLLHSPFRFTRITYRRRRWISVAGLSNLFIL